MANGSNAELSSLFRAKLASSLLDQKDATRLHMRVVGPDVLAKHKLPPGPAIEIPYFTMNGSVNGFRRFRYLRAPGRGFEVLAERRKPLRYVQPKNSGVEVYLPPFLPWVKVAKDVSTDILITEGEFKAACVAKNAKIPCMGLGGVWNFRSKQQGVLWLPMLEKFEWAGRAVYVVFDSDTAVNPDVQIAEQALCDQLLQREAIPYIVRIPPPPEGKMGLDDFILQEGVDEFKDLLSYAEEWHLSRVLYKMNERFVYVRSTQAILDHYEEQRLVPVGKFPSYWVQEKLVIKSTTPKGEVKLTEKDAAPEWLRWAGRSEVSKLTYEPGAARGLSGTTYNTWTGWGVEPKKGDVRPWNEALDHVFGKEKEARAWFEQWCAYPLQNPGTKMFCAVLLWSIMHGVGKNLLEEGLIRIYGRNATRINKKHLESDFNEWEMNKQFIVGNEITGDDKRNMSDLMKDRTTQTTKHINQKGIARFEMPDCANYYFTSNHANAFYIEQDDRRYFVHEVKAAPKPAKWYDDYFAWLDKGGTEALFYHLLHLDVSDFKPKAHALMTDSKMAMIEGGRSEMEAWAFRLRAGPDACLRVGDSLQQGDAWTAADLKPIYELHSQARCSTQALGRALKAARIPMFNDGKQVKLNGHPERVYLVRNADKWLNAPTEKLSEHYNRTRGTETSSEKKQRKF